ncbi:MAG TPA: 50S ribosomal protein L11 methyltransferase [Clostridiaceae bacterium]|nr:50S ribosomal protein L11 methyltransferase [Clostridiaceae bacterium]
MKWTEVRIKTTGEAYDAISEMLTSIGAGGVVIEDPKDIRKEIEKPGTLDYADNEFLNSLGEDVTVKAYFPESFNINELKQLIKEKLSYISRFLDIGKGSIDFSELCEDDWANAWKKYYRPLHLSQRLVVTPSWEHYESREGEIVIRLDPGMAFGTGTHETTQMCAIMLEKYTAKGDSVIDVGCGSGILSIIAAKLGASQVTAVDIDEIAVKVTKENLVKNNVSGHVTATVGVLADLKKSKADIVVANIIADVIIDMVNVLPYYLKAGGHFIASGIIKERAEEVREVYCNRGFDIVEKMEKGEWVAMVFRCRSSL